MKNSGYILRISSQIFLSLMLILLTSALITAEAFEGGGRSRLFNVKDGLFSAELDSVPLSAVLENMKVISRIRYKADEDVLNERITVTFTNLSTEDALKRILSKYNHVMMFDSDGVPVNIYIFGKKDNKAGNTAIAGSVSSTQIRENPIQQRETRKNIHI